MIHNGKAGFIDHQDGGLLAKVLKNRATQIIAYPLSIPDRLREQALHAIRTRFSGMFGQLPTVFARDLTHDSFEEGQQATMRFGTGKARSKTCMQHTELLDPTPYIAQGGVSSRSGGIVFLLQESLLSGESCQRRFLSLQHLIFFGEVPEAFFFLGKGIIAVVLSAAVVFRRRAARFLPCFWWLSGGGPSLVYTVEVRTTTEDDRLLGKASSAGSNMSEFRSADRERIV